jgi:hypothetical protein
MCLSAGDDPTLVFVEYTPPHIYTATDLTNVCSSVLEFEIQPMALRSHLTVLETSASLYSSATAFLIPQLDSESGKITQWQPVTYRQVQNDVQLVAQYWARTLEADGVPRGSVVGLW